MTVFYLNLCYNKACYKGTTVLCRLYFAISETVVFVVSETGVKVMAFLHSSHIENQKEILSTVMLRKYIWVISRNNLSLGSLI